MWGGQPAGSVDLSFLPGEVYAQGRTTSSSKLRFFDAFRFGSPGSRVNFPCFRMQNGLEHDRLADIKVQ